MQRQKNTTVARAKIGLVTALQWPRLMRPESCCAGAGALSLRFGLNSRLRLFACCRRKGMPRANKLQRSNHGSGP